MQRSAAPYRPPLIRRPSAAGNTNGTPGRCPFLGTPADPGTSLAFPSEANHCFRSRFPIPISSIHQENYCLSLQYESCPVYRQFMTENEATAAPVVAVSGVALGGAAVAAEQSRRPAESAGSAIAPAMAVGAGMALGAGRAAPAWPLAEAELPDFATDPGPAPEPESRRRGVEGRTVLLGVLLLALLLLAGWAWLTFLDGRDSPTTALGTVVTLPTLAATTDLADGQSDGSVAVGAAAEATATALVAAAGSAAAATTDAAGATAVAAVDSVAATATALFAGAVATAECHAPDWWVSYVTLEGDTVEGLAISRGILPEELIVANCLASPDLAPGTQLRLPPVGVIVLLASPTPIPVTPTPPVAVQPTRRPPLVIPIATFPVVIIIPTSMPLVPEPGDPPDDDPPGARPPAVRPTATPAIGARPTSTPPGVFPTVGATRTPPSWATVEPTRTPPGWDSSPTLTPPTP